MLVLFDVGGVTLRLNNKRLYDELGRISGSAQGYLMKQYANIERRANAGQIDAAGFVELTRELLRTDLPDDQVVRLIASPWAGTSQDVLSVKRRVHQSNHSVGIFSNVSELALQVLSQRHPVIYESYGGPLFYSCRLGSTKPQPTMYDSAAQFAAENDLGTPILIDDNRANTAVGSANPYNWNCITFLQNVDPDEPGRLLEDADTPPVRSATKEARTTEDLVVALAEFGVDVRGCE